MPLLGAVDEGLSRPSRRPDIEGLRGLVVSAAVALPRRSDPAGRHRELGEHVPRRGCGGWAPPASRSDAFFVLAGRVRDDELVELPRAGAARPGRRPATSPSAGHAGSSRRSGQRPSPSACRHSSPAASTCVELGLLASTQQYLSQDLPAIVDLPMWSMTTEIQFYVALPLLAFLGRRWCAVPLLRRDRSSPAPRGPRCRNRLGLAEGLLPGRVSQFVGRHGRRPPRAAGATRPAAVGGTGSTHAWRGGRPASSRSVALGTYHGATFQRGEDTLVRARPAPGRRRRARCHRAAHADRRPGGVPRRPRAAGSWA